MKNLDDLHQRLQQQMADGVGDPDRMSFEALDCKRFPWGVERKTLFYSYFKVLPHQISIYFVKIELALDWFISNYEPEIWNFHLSEWYGDGELRKVRHAYFCLFEDVMIHFDYFEDKVTVLYRRTPKGVTTLLTDQLSHLFGSSKNENSSINIIENTGHGLDLTRIGITQPTVLLEDNYNDDFQDVHQTILQRLTKTGDKGLVMLHGKPGTGKTTYIRYLIGAVGKRIIFLPPTLAETITDPSLLSLLSNYTNSILVIEDAENIVIDRERGGSSAVSALLNISDGLLSDCLNIQIICSFNTDVSRIDKALMRKGRLIAKYEFQELEPDKATRLSARLGKGKVYDDPVLLTDIYNPEEREYEHTKQKAAIGFMI